MTHDLKWLRENALFACYGCDVSSTVRNGHLKKDPDGNPTCENCWDFSREQDVSNWHTLPPFDPFDGVVDREQIDRLANFIMGEVDGEPSRSEGAVDCAIRIIKDRNLTSSSSTPPASDTR